MPNFPVIDTHLHIWDHSRLTYSLFHGHPIFEQNFHVEDYQRACGDVAIEAMVFLECYADFDAHGGQYLDEIEFVMEEAKRDPRIRAIVPMAPLERGEAVRPMLAAMVERYPMVRGIRRIIEFDADPRALALSDAFIAGVKALPDYGLHFEINVNHTQMEIVHDFVARVPEVPLILDHCGKPGIKEGALEQFSTDMARLAQHKHVWIKLSDLPVEADFDTWTEADLRPYIDAVLDNFGTERVIFGADWPVCLQATSIPRWIEVLDRALAHLDATALRNIYRDNANRFYRLGL